MERKTEKLALVVTAEEKELARRLADRDGVSVATAVRRLIRTAARSRRVWPEREAITCAR